MEEYDYELPKSAIAQVPVEPRSSARLLDGTRGPSSIVDRRVSDLGSLLGPGDLVVVNDTKVIPARLNLFRKSGGAVELLLVDRLGEFEWEAMVRPSARVRVGERLVFADQEVAEVHETLSEAGTRRVELLQELASAAYASIPFPPYIDNAPPDVDRYQTIYANRPGSVAAPTAGLHLDQFTLDAIQRCGAGLVKLELQVGLGTFLPIKTTSVTDHVMHSERYVVSEETWSRVKDANRVLAVGTTVVRALESAAISGALTGRTDLFIKPGFNFKVVDLLMTNFHVPKSTLLVMMAAFYGERWRDLYTHGLSQGYRFLSFGDAMLLGRLQGSIGVENGLPG